ncbi:zinc ABC transporter solute-binding protein [Cryomorpha ignava]|uniref:Zinc ABC transporter solute-binding protein n=1 Tax=Cryomorpha ignava TaxID=101383 RepID=A0A7K3WRJ0_9FLAO|nr:zinc ABC transporter substrate-binding protein [Cryomorpha ignava]NEN24136.1 zinc ABC transporter solute-binding protein [Cryomorpha ignava]
MRYLLFCLIISVGCTSAPNEGSQKLKIVCTTGIIADAVSEITNDSCIVISLMGPGTDPHLFKPTKESLDDMASADIIVSNGLHLEGRMQDILHKLERTKKVIFLGEALDSETKLYGDEAKKIPDPHIWFDVEIWKTVITYLGDELLQVAPECTDPERIIAYTTQLEDLDIWVSEEMSSIPEPQRVLITAHDAFSYFGRAYNTEVIGLQGISTMAEYGIRDVTNLVDLVISREIKAAFVETSVSSRSIEAVIAGCKDRGYNVKEGGSLYSDALGGKDSGAATYIDMVKTNVSTIKKALK